MTVAQLIAELEVYDPGLPVGILYDGQHGFYPVHEVRVSKEEQVFLVEGGASEGTIYICVCDKP